MYMNGNFYVRKEVLSFQIHKDEIIAKTKKGGHPGLEPGTSRTQSENHNP